MMEPDLKVWFPFHSHVGQVSCIKYFNCFQFSIDQIISEAEPKTFRCWGRSPNFRLIPRAGTKGPLGPGSPKYRPTILIICQIYKRSSKRKQSTITCTSHKAKFVPAKFSSKLGPFYLDIPIYLKIRPYACLSGRVGFCQSIHPLMI